MRGKQDLLTAGENITITNGVISATGGAVDSVNGKTGVVDLTAEDVGALSDSTVIPTVPTNVSAFANDVGYLTQHQSLDGYATESWVEGKGYVTDISGKQDKLTAGDGISIENNVISTSGGGAVTSVNGKTGDVVLTASDVDAQDVLVSGTNIKTVNGSSLLGSGDIEVTGGLEQDPDDETGGIVLSGIGTLAEVDGTLTMQDYAADAKVTGVKISELQTGKQDKLQTLAGSGSYTIDMLADNTVYTITDCTSLTVSAYPTAFYHAVIDVTFSEDGGLLVLPDETVFIGDAPDVAACSRWNISIMNGVAVAGEVSA